MKNKGQDAFQAYYREIFGARWETLSECLKADPCYYSYDKGLIKPYNLDEASVAAAESLNINSGDKVLDMCAAPGGKSLVISGMLNKNVSLTANERSSARRFRLKKVLADHLPASIFEKISITGHNALIWLKYEQNAYDKILLDAPCSSERHVITSSAQLELWSPSRIKRLSQQQFAMLASALEVVKPGGLILYCTCALTPRENDDVIEKLLKRRPGRFEIIPTEAKWGQPSKFGWQIFPDICGGRGPIYFCKIKKSRLI